MARAVVTVWAQPFGHQVFILQKSQASALEHIIAKAGLEYKEYSEEELRGWWRLEESKAPA